MASQLDFMLGLNDSMDSCNLTPIPKNVNSPLKKNFIRDDLTISPGISFTPGRTRLDTASKNHLKVTIFL